MPVRCEQPNGGPGEPMTEIATWVQAAEWLRTHVVESREMGWGLLGRWVDGTREYEFKISGDHDGGIETAVRPEPGRLVWWIHAATLDEMLQMFISAQSSVNAARAPTWLDALKERDPIRWMDPDHLEP